MLTKKYNLEENIEIVFFGKLMKNDRRLSDYNLSNSTTLHVMPSQSPVSKVSDQNYYSNSMASSKCRYLTGLWLHRNNYETNTLQRLLSLFGNLKNDNAMQKCSQVEKERLSAFYVCCKNKCGGIVPGKLRVRCSSCLKSEIVLQREPVNIMEILFSSIFCTCYSESCKHCLQKAEFYFKCGSDYCDNTEVKLVKCMKANFESKECCTCFENSNPIVEFPCDESHILCTDCFIAYARTEIFDRRLDFNTLDGYCLPCPVGCKSNGLDDPHVFYLLGVDEYKIYQEIATEACLLRGMNGCICPDANCGMGLFKTTNSKNEKYCKCSDCGYEFCFECKRSYHGLTGCSNLSISSRTSQSMANYINNVKLIKCISKPCPNCKIPTEKNGGCMHLICSNCKYEWCWICQKLWSGNCQSDHWFG